MLTKTLKTMGFSFRNLRFFYKRHFSLDLLSHQALHYSPEKVLNSSKEVLNLNLGKITSPEVFAETFLRIQASGFLLENPDFKLKLFSTFTKFPLSSFEKFPLIFLINIISEIKAFTSETNGEIIEKSRNLLIFHLQKQEFDGFKRILEIMTINPEVLRKFQDFNASGSLIISIIRENLTYYSMALSLDILPFLDLIRILQGDPWKLPIDFLKSGLNLKLNNKRFFSAELNNDEIQGILNLDQEYLSTQAFIQKSLAFFRKNPKDFLKFPLEALIKILISSYKGRFEFDFGMINELEDLINKKIKTESLDNVDLWVKAGNYYSFIENNERFREILSDEMIEQLITSIKEGKQSLQDQETLIFLEKARTFFNENQIKSFEILLNNTLLPYKPKAQSMLIDSKLLYVTCLYSSQFSKEKLSILNEICQDINEKTQHLSSLIFLFKTLDLIQSSFDAETIKNVKSRLEFLLKLILKNSPLQNLIKNLIFSRSKSIGWASLSDSIGFWVISFNFCSKRPKKL